MKVILTRGFLKNLRKLLPQLREQFKMRRDIFLQNPFHPILRNHKLHGEYEGYRSINITGDIRAVYRQQKDVVTFVSIGTHGELYE